MPILKILFALCFIVILVTLIKQLTTIVNKLKDQNKITFPLLEADIEDMLGSNQAKLQPPTLKGQKGNLILWVAVILFVAIASIIIMFSDKFDAFAFLLLFVPLFNTPRMISLFAVTDDGLMCGERFLNWKRVKWFQFIPITPNHKYYGYSKEMNDGYELKIDARVFFPISYIVTSEETKERIQEVLHQYHVTEKQEQS